MKFDRIEYQVGELAEAPQLLTIDGSGHARYESHTNWGALDQREIGSYEMRLPEAEIVTLGSALARPAFDSLPDHWGSVKPGDRYRRVRVTTGGTSTEKLVGTKGEIAPALAALLERLDAIVGLIASHPLEVLRIELRQPSVREGSVLSFVLVLSAAGTEPVTCRNPIDLAAGENGSVSVSIWPEQAAAAPRPEDTLTVRANAIRRLAPLTVSEGGVLELQPGASAEFEVNAVVPSLQSGNALLRVSYANFLPRMNERQLVVGELLSRTTSTVVPPQATPVTVAPR